MLINPNDIPRISEAAELALRATSPNKLALVITIDAQGDPQLFLAGDAHTMPVSDFPKQNIESVDRADTVCIQTFTTSSTCKLMTFNGTQIHVHIP
jgi:hypothetical protein